METPVEVVLAFDEMLPRLRAEEALAALDVAAAARFDMRPSSRRQLVRQWSLAARPRGRRRSRRRKPATPAELAAVGIAFRLEERPGGPRGSSGAQGPPADP